MSNSSKIVGQKRRTPPSRTLLQESRLITHLDFQGAAALDQCCNAVCRIVMNGPKGDLWGTGFVIGNRLLMTNHHVLDSHEKCDKSKAEFFLEKQKKKVKVKFKPADLFITSQSPSTGPDGLDIDNLDFTIVAIEDHPDLKEIFTHPICLNEFENPQEQGLINLIHHPDGKSKAIHSAKYLGHQISKVHEFYFTYRADTAPGSSGSPVFNSSWRLIGLHRQTEGKNSSSDKVAIKAGAIYYQLFKNDLLEKIQQLNFQPLEEVTNAKKILHLLKQIYREGATIQRFSGGSLPLETHYINLQIVKEEEQKNKEAKLGKSPENKKDREAESLSYHHNHLPTYEEIFAPKEPIAIDQLFDPQKGETSEMRLRRLVLGKAGIGKSTFCQHAAYQWAQGKLWNDHFDWVFLIPLRELNDHPYKTNLKKFIYEKWFSSKKEGDFEDFWDKEIASSRKVLFLLDGYDELSSTINLTNLLKPYVSASILVTSRPYGISDLYDYQQRLEIVGFTDENIEQFIGHCFNDANSSSANTSAIPTTTAAVFTHTNSTDNKSQLKESLLQFLDQNPVIKGIAHIPIQLDLLCTIWEDQKLEMTQSISMTNLYHQLEIYLLRRHFKLIESTADSTIENDGATLIQFLSNLAFFAMKKESLIISMNSIDDAERSVEKKTKGHLIDALRMGVLKKIEGKQEYYFVHLTFQEYYAARYLAFHLKNPSKQAENFIRTEKYNRRMQFVFWFAAGLCRLEDKRGSLEDNPPPSLTDRLFQKILEEPRDILGIYDVRLGIRLLEESECPDTQISEELQRKTQTLIFQIIKSDPKKEMIGLLFDLLKISPIYVNNYVIPDCVKNLQSNVKEYKIQACQILRNLSMTHDHVNTIIEELLVLFNDTKVEVREAACWALSCSRLSDDHADKIIQKLPDLLNDTNTQLRHAALKMLDHFTDNQVDKFLPIFLNFLKHSDEHVSSKTWIKLMQLSRNNKNVFIQKLLPLLKKPEEQVRIFVLTALATLRLSKGEAFEIAQKPNSILSGNSGLLKLVKLEASFEQTLILFQAVDTLSRDTSEMVRGMKWPMLINLTKASGNQGFLLMLWFFISLEIPSFKLPDSTFMRTEFILSIEHINMVMDKLLPFLTNYGTKPRDAINELENFLRPTSWMSLELKPLIHYENADFKRAACLVLERLEASDEQAVAIFNRVLPLFDHTDKEIREVACKVLDRLRISVNQTIPIMKLIIPLLQKDHIEVKRSACSALRRLKPPFEQIADVGEVLLPLLDQTDNIISVIDLKAQVKKVERALVESATAATERSVKEAAIEAIGEFNIPDGQAVEMVSALLDFANAATSEKAKVLAINALWKVKIQDSQMEKVVSNLVELATAATDVTVQVTAINALKKVKIPDSQVEKVVRELVKFATAATDVTVQITAKLVLGKLKASEAQVRNVVSSLELGDLKFVQELFLNITRGNPQEISEVQFHQLVTTSELKNFIYIWAKSHRDLADFISLCFKYNFFNEPYLKIIIELAYKEQSTICIDQGCIYLYHKRGMQRFSKEGGWSSESLKQLEKLKKLGNEFMKRFENTADTTPPTLTTSSYTTRNSTTTTSNST